MSSFSFFEEIESLLKYAEQNAAKPLDGDVDPKMEERLSLLEKAFANWKGALLSGTKPIDIKTQLNKLSPKEMKLLERWTNLGLSTAALSVALQNAHAKKTKGNLKKVGKNTKKSIQIRQRKFKGIGGNAKWKKL